MGVDLSQFDPQVWTGKRIAEERRLYAAAGAGDDGAAAALQFWRARFGALEALDVDGLIRQGELEEQARLLTATTLPNNRKDREWHHSAAFGVVKRSTRPKSPSRLLEIRHAHGVLLTTMDLEVALTTEYAKRTKGTPPKLKRGEWPDTVLEVELELVAYVCHLFKGTDPAQALAYVHDSFPGIPWTEAEEDVEYPADWL